MKKFLILILSILLLSGCGANKESSEDVETIKPKEHYDVVFLSGPEFIYDNGVNERCLYGIKDYCEANELKYSFLEPAVLDESAMEEVFAEAVEEMGCKLLVASGHEWDHFLAKRLEDYPQLKAIYVDAQGRYAKENAPSHPDNLAVIGFREEEAAYMVGYALIKDGYRKLGFIVENGGELFDQVASAFVQGITDALAEMQTKEEEEKDTERENVQLLYACAEENLPEKAAEWYAEGTEVIFVCGDELTDQLIPIARESGNGKFVGWRYDEYVRKALDGEDYEPLFVTSTVNDVEGMVYNAVKAAFAKGGGWNLYSGKDIFRVGVKEAGVSLSPYRTINWRTFTKSDYDALKQRVSYGVNISSSESVFENEYEGLEIILSE